MRGKPLLEQDLTLKKLVKIFVKTWNKSKFKPKKWLTKRKKVFHQIKNLRKNQDKPNLVKVLRYLQSEKICVTVLQN